MRHLTHRHKFDVNFIRKTYIIELMPKTLQSLRHSTHRGFSLLEIVLSMFLVLAIITMIISASSTYISSRSSGLRTVAARITSRQIETLRKLDYDTLPASGLFSDPDLSRLPQSSATQTLTDYQGSPDIKLVTVQVNWSENSAAKQVLTDTLIFRYGLK